MLNEELATMGLAGSYRDVLRDDAGRITWDSGWKKNQILIDCRRLLAAFMISQANTRGVKGLKVGRGDPAWDGALPPPPQDTDTLVDASPVAMNVGDLVPGSSDLAVKLAYINPSNGTVSLTPTRRLQIVATLGAGVTVMTLREFGLFGQLDGGEVLINLVRHVAIVKDPVSTLVRTIQLVF